MKIGNLFRNYYFSVFLLIFILFSLSYLAGFSTLDPDFGWHIKTGELILQYGVPMVDWYTFTMPNFLWIDHAWLTNIFIYQIHEHFGFHALLALFLLLAISAFLIFIKREHFYYYFAIIYLGFLSIIGFLGIRPQIITVFFIALLWKIILDFLYGKNKAIFILPILFILWVNLHGGFFAGLFILFLVLSSEIFKKIITSGGVSGHKFFGGQYFYKQPMGKLIVLTAISIMSFVATLFNPYGIRVYNEVFSSAGDHFLRFHIVEWLPLLFAEPSLLIIFYLSCVGVLSVLLRKDIEWTKLIVIFVFLTLSLLSQRHFFIFVVLSVPIFVDIVLLLREKINPERLKFLLAGSGKVILSLFVLLLFFPTIYGVLKNLFVGKVISGHYPVEAVSYLENISLSENLFNEYAWGGYLIWKLPERKVFIDGRMPSWRQDDQFVFGDYIAISIAQDDFESLLDKYQVTVILIKKEQKKDFSENKITNTLGKVFHSFRYHPKSLEKELLKVGWSVVYEDDIAIVLKR